jgi:uncharacterized integral membrane protein
MSTDMPVGIVLGAIAVVGLVALIVWEVVQIRRLRKRMTRWLREHRND